MRETRSISYANSAQSGFGRRFVGLVEAATGRRRLIKRAEGYARDVTDQGDFWQVMLDRYDLTLDVITGDLANIPKRGPVIVLANHPFGILDGLMMGYILSRVRGDFRILANDVFQNAPEVEQAVIPIAFDRTQAAKTRNLQSRKQAVAHLNEGGVLGVFPGGTVSTARQPFGTPLDPEWRRFSARLIARSDAVVIPMFFEGRTSRMFQIASHLHMNLRLALLMNEFRQKLGQSVSVSIGEPIAQDALALHSKDPRQMMDFLRRSTYEMSSKPIDASTYGYDFDLRGQTSR